MSLASNSIREVLRGLPALAAPLPPFPAEETPPEPAALFEEWLRAAIDAGVREPHAMTLSTVDAEGRPDARVLILKNLVGATWQFATSSLSPKGRQLGSTPWAALTFYWPTLGRQIRIRGRVITASPAESAQDFLDRAPAARAVAATGNQSKPLAGQEGRREAVRHAGLVTEFPAWTVYGVAADAVEFWQGDPDRDHTRLRYTPTDGGWEKTLLWP